MAYQGNPGGDAYGREEDHRLHDLPPGNVSIMWSSLHLPKLSNNESSNTISRPSMEMTTNSRMNNIFWLTSRDHSMDHLMNIHLVLLHLRFGLRRITAYQNPTWEIIREQRLHTVVFSKRTTATIMINIHSTRLVHLVGPDELSRPTSEVKPAPQKPGSKDKLLVLQL